MARKGVVLYRRLKNWVSVLQPCSDLYEKKKEGFSVTDDRFRVQRSELSSTEKNERGATVHPDKSFTVGS